MSQFKERVIKAVNSIPYGKVASYGQIANFVGSPRAARQVGWILNRLEGAGDVPWWRIVNNQGRISIKGSKFNANDQKVLMEKEGIIVREDLTFDIENYRFRPSESFIKNLELDEEYTFKLMQKYGV